MDQASQARRPPGGSVTALSGAVSGATASAAEASAVGEGVEAAGKSGGAESAGMVHSSYGRMNLLPRSGYFRWLAPLCPQWELA